MILKMKSPLMIQLIIEMKRKSRTNSCYFVFSFYNVENDEKIQLKDGKTIKLKGPVIL